MKNKELYQSRDGEYAAFNAFCLAHGKPSSQDCVGCSLYGITLGGNSCFHNWLQLEAETSVSTLRPWTFDEVRQRIGLVIDYRRPNCSQASYMILGAYKAQNGRVTVLLCGDALSVDKLSESKHYSINGTRCGTWVVPPIRRIEENTERAKA